MRRCSCGGPHFHGHRSFFNHVFNHVRELSLITFTVHTLSLKFLVTVQIKMWVLKIRHRKGERNNRFHFSFFRRSLGVTLWELFDNAAQPYSHLSNLDVLNHVIRERDTKLPKPQLEQPYSDRWLVTSCFVLLPSKDKEVLFPWVLVIYSQF